MTVIILIQYKKRVLLTRDKGISKPNEAMQGISGTQSVGN